uniref:Zinc finger, C2H2 n=1 Tax=Tanacetum cinerariifolium TaxID=118510 RepID=A0A699HN24_TANCI|nr:zinc finger, C2H2 [Tanacetum cinerariifolium]
MHMGTNAKRAKKKFKPFQALGGHQGIHKKIKPNKDNVDDMCMLRLNIIPNESVHQCKMCSKVFEIGHMRKHRHEKGGKRRRRRMERVAIKICFSLESSRTKAGLKSFLTGYFQFPYYFIMGGLRSREDDVQKISTSIFVMNFSEQFIACDLWGICTQYENVIDAFIPNRRSKAGFRFGKST